MTKKFGIQYLESGIHGVKSKTQDRDCLGFAYTGSELYHKEQDSYQ